ncbi:MAG: Stp1/IreP family PP2C-type Ser/Thr phosphatase [Acidobacteria bacterium]|nr:Stp1/IreP family PP2C-type Ser/Thr phosphatase [Acidobacteriota bacterium]
MGASLVSLTAWGQTDVGMKRRLNEDFFLIDDEIGAYLVADGMGGHAAGDVASRLAAERIVESLHESAGMQEQDASPVSRLRTAILSGHERLMEAVRRDPSLKGMGTTVVVAFHPRPTHELFIAHVGDSRVYRFRDGALELLTEDHSWVHEQVAAGFLSEEAARKHPLKNVVTQALGGGSEPQVEIHTVPILAGDLYLLCSDGLNVMIRDEEIGRVLAQNPALKDASRNLIIEANRAGGNDNITVVLLKAEAS